MKYPHFSRNYFTIKKYKLCSEMYFMLGNVDSELRGEPLRREHNESFPVTEKRHYDDVSSVTLVISNYDNHAARIILLMIKDLYKSVANM